MKRSFVAVLLGTVFCHAVVSAVPVPLDVDTSSFPQVRVLMAGESGRGNLQFEELIDGRRVVAPMQRIPLQQGEVPWEIVFVLDNRGPLPVMDRNLYRDVLRDVVAEFEETTYVGIVSFGEGGGHRSPSGNPHHSAKVLLEPTRDRSQFHRALQDYRTNSEEADFTWPALRRAVDLVQRPSPEVRRRLIVVLLHRDLDDRNEQLIWRSGLPRAVIYTVMRDRFETPVRYAATMRANAGDVISIDRSRFTGNPELLREGIAQVLQRADVQYYWLSFTSQHDDLANLSRSGRLLGQGIPAAGVPLAYTASADALRREWRRRLVASDEELARLQAAMLRAAQAVRRERDQVSSDAVAWRRELDLLRTSIAAFDAEILRNEEIRVMLSDSRANIALLREESENFRSIQRLLAAHLDVQHHGGQVQPVLNAWAMLADRSVRHFPEDNEKFREMTIAASAQLAEKLLSQNNLDDAARVLREASRGGATEDWRIQAASGRHAMAIGRWSDARTLLRNVFERTPPVPGRVEAGLDLIIAMDRSGASATEMADWIERVLAAVEDAALLPNEHRLIYAEALRVSGRQGDAIREARRIYVGPSSQPGEKVSAADLLALAHHELGEWNEAHYFLSLLRGMDETVYQRNPLIRE